MDSKQTGWANLVFYLVLALLIIHEMDAVARHEWRLLPGLSGLSDELGRLVFILLHIPILVGLFWASNHSSVILRQRTQLSIDLIVVVHAIAHWMMSSHSLYEFEAPIETISIYGGALAGMVHAALLSGKMPGFRG